MTRRRFLTLATLTLITLVLAATTLVPSARAQDDPALATRDVALDTGWNLVGWTGDSAAIDTLSAQIGDPFQRLQTFDAAGQSFDAFDVAAPAFLNTTNPVAAGAGAWVFVSDPVTWTQPVILDARSVALAPGFNLVTWTGRSGTPIADALAAIADGVIASFLYDQPSGRFLFYGPGQPAFLNTAGAVNYGDALWVNAARALTWQQPAPPPPGVVLADDGSAQLIVPVGALPVGADLNDITVTNVTAAADAESPDDVPVLAAYRLEPDGLQFPSPAILSVPTDLTSGAVVALQIGDTTEVVDGVSVRFDAATGAATLRSPISHFSENRIVHLIEGLKIESTAIVGLTVLDTTFTAGGVLTTKNPFVDPQSIAAAMQLMDSIRDASLFDANWTVTAKFNDPEGPVRQSGALSPSRFLGVRENTSTPFTAPFTCTGLGDFRLYFEATAKVLFEASFALPDGDRTFVTRATGILWTGAALTGTCTDASGGGGGGGQDPPPDLINIAGTADFTAGTCPPFVFNDILFVTVSTSADGDVTVELRQPSTGDVNTGAMQIQVDGSWVFFAERDGGGESYGGRFSQNEDGAWTFSAVNNYNNCVWEVFWVQG